MAILKIDWRPEIAVLRRFGSTFLLSAAVFVVVLWFMTGNGQLTWAVGATLGVAGGLMVLAPSFGGRYAYLLLMAPAFVIGSVVSRLLVGVLYYCVVTPIGLVMRLMGRDPLGLVLDGRESYFMDVVSGGERHERPY